MFEEVLANYVSKVSQFEIPLKHHQNKSSLKVFLNVAQCAFISYSFCRMLLICSFQIQFTIDTV